MLSYSELQNLCHKNEFKFFDNGAFNVNIIGIRRNIKRNTYDDLMLLAFKDNNGKQIVKSFAATTEAGSPYLINPLNPKGTLRILSNQQYRGVWRLGKHKGVYEALVQCGTFLGQRDNSKDLNFDSNSPIMEINNAGVNCHTTDWRNYLVPTLVNKYSAACQVLQNPKEFFNEFLPIVKKSMSLYGDKVTY